MITELPKQQFHRIKHLTNQCRNVEVKSIVAGNNLGRVFVDHPTEPTAALIWIEGQEGFQIVGDAQSKLFITGLEAYIRNVLEPQLTMRNIDYVEIGLDSSTWDHAIHVSLSKRKLSSDIQHVFSTTGSIQAISFPVDGDMNVQRIDLDLLKSERLSNYLLLERKILRFWNSMDEFAQQGFGYIAVVNNDIVSLCFSAFVADQTHAIDIETLEEYKRKGYATAVASAFMQECVQKGLKPYWDCSPDNIGSIRLANLMGLTSDFDYKIVWYNGSSRHEEQ